MKKNEIWDYFNENIDYPSDVALNPIPYGTVWNYISSTFLNGFVNYVKPIACFVLDRYAEDNELVGERNFTVCNKGEFGKWHKWEGTKKELIESIVNETKEMGHTKLDCFGDDIVILAEIETDKYMFFWYDMDCSDCSIGRFETTEPKEKIINSVVNWLEREKMDNNGKIVTDGFDNGIVNYHKLPISFLEGWVSF